MNIGTLQFAAVVLRPILAEELDGPATIDFEIVPFGSGFALKIEWRPDEDLDPLIDRQLVLKPKSDDGLDIGEAVRAAFNRAVKALRLARDERECGAEHDQA